MTVSPSEPFIDFVIPVYNEGQNILSVLKSLKQYVKTSYRVLICYDRDDDDTLTALKTYPAKEGEVLLVKNNIERGPHGAVRSGFAKSTASAVIMLPADDDYNANIIDQMVEQFRTGSEIVCASRFIPGGCMEGCTGLKHALVKIAAFTLRNIAFLPTHDPTNGFRLFSRRVLQSISLESTQGFTFSLEYLVKAHRLRWKISEIPARWYQRQAGQSRFKVIGWLIPYLRWYFFGFATTYLRRGPETIKLMAL